VTGKKPVLLSLVPGYAENYRPKALDKKYPKVLTELNGETYCSASKETLLNHYSSVFDELQVSNKEARNCELDTRTQFNSKQWFSFRTGRITASRFKAVCRTSLENPSKSLLKEICYPASKNLQAK